MRTSTRLLLPKKNHDVKVPRENPQRNPGVMTESFESLHPRKKLKRISFGYKYQPASEFDVSGRRSLKKLLRQAGSEAWNDGRQIISG